VQQEIEDARQAKNALEKCAQWWTDRNSALIQLVQVYTASVAVTTVVTALVANNIETVGGWRILCICMAVLSGAAWLFTEKQKGDDAQLHKDTAHRLLAQYRNLLLDMGAKPTEEKANALREELKRLNTDSEAYRSPQPDSHVRCWGYLLWIVLMGSYWGYVGYKFWEKLPSSS
jgi:hypothetical protein